MNVLKKKLEGQNIYIILKTLDNGCGDSADFSGLNDACDGVDAELTSYAQMPAYPPGWLKEFVTNRDDCLLSLQKSPESNVGESEFNVGESESYIGECDSNIGESESNVGESEFITNRDNCLLSLQKSPISIDYDDIVGDGGDQCVSVNDPVANLVFSPSHGYLFSPHPADFFPSPHKRPLPFPASQSLDIDNFGDSSDDGGIDASDDDNDDCVYGGDHASNFVPPDDQELSSSPDYRSNYDDEDSCDDNDGNYDGCDIGDLSECSIEVRHLNSFPERGVYPHQASRIRNEFFPGKTSVTMDDVNSEIDKNPKFAHFFKDLVDHKKKQEKKFPET